jgi:phage terminase Nu1 subunit (DNA packaging protein)
MKVEVLDAPINGHGGKRAGAGRKTKEQEQAPENVSFNEWKARNERAKALTAEFNLEVEQGKYVERAAYVQAMATAYASIAQTLRSIPDHLERRLGIAPELAEEIGRQIDDSLSNLATEFELLGGGDA